MYNLCIILLKIDPMSTTIRISDDLINYAKMVSQVENRSLTGQIEYWAKIGRIAEENPDMTYLLIKEILRGQQEIESGKLSEYKFS